MANTPVREAFQMPTVQNARCLECCQLSIAITAPGTAPIQQGGFPAVGSERVNKAL